MGETVTGNTIVQMNVVTIVMSTEREVLQDIIFKYTYNIEALLSDMCIRDQYEPLSSEVNMDQLSEVSMNSCYQISA